MATTFFALAKNADFEAAAPAEPPSEEGAEDEVPADEGREPELGEDDGRRRQRRPAVDLGGLVYNIQIQLPESRDPAVYDALFGSLRTHLLT